MIMMIMITIMIIILIMITIILIMIMMMIIIIIIIICHGRVQVDASFFGQRHPKPGPPAATYACVHDTCPCDVYDVYGAYVVLPYSQFLTRDLQEWGQRPWRILD